MESSKQKKFTPFFNDISPIITPKSNISNSFISNKDNLSLNMNSCIKIPQKSFSSRLMTSTKKNIQNISKTHNTTNESFSMDQKLNTDTFKYTNTFESSMPNRKDSCEKDEDLNFHENMPYNIEIIEYEEFIPEEDINTTLSKSYPPKYIDKEQNKIEKNTFLSSENVKEAIFNKKENENQEFYIKHLINEVKKSSTCAKSYREENEALKGKINFLNNKMSVKDQKIEEITNLLKNNNENLNTSLIKEKLTENYLTQIEQLKNLIEKQTIALEEKDKQNLVFSKKYELFSSDFANISNENIQIKSELTYLKTQLENYIKLNNKKEYSFEALGEKQTDKEEKYVKNLNKIISKPEDSIRSIDEYRKSFSKVYSNSPYKLISENLLVSCELEKDRKNEQEKNIDSNKIITNNHIESIKLFNSSENFFNNKVSKVFNTIKEDMKKAFLTTKIESYKQESENSLTERIKDRQSHKSKSIMDDTNYKNIMNSNNVSKTYTPEGLAFKQIVKNNGRSTSSYNISNVNTNYNSYNINLNQNYNPTKNTKIGFDGPQNRISKLADNISFKTRQNQLNAIKTKLFEMNTVKGEQARKDLPNPRFIATSIAFDFNGNNSAITKYNSER